jgi:hypothetical protein
MALIGRNKEATGGFEGEDFCSWTYIFQKVTLAVYSRWIIGSVDKRENCPFYN